MSYNTTKHGQAEYGRYGQLSLAQVAALTAQEGPDLDPRDPASKFCSLVYQVNPSPINLSGEVIVDGVRINGYDMVNDAQVDSGHNLWVKDQTLITATQNLSSNILNVELAVENLSADLQAMNSSIHELNGLSGNILNSNDTYSRIVASSGAYIYVMHAVPPALSGHPVWRVQRVDSDGSRMWADGDSSFDNIASGYLDLTYSY